MIQYLKYEYSNQRGKDSSRDLRNGSKRTKGENVQSHHKVISVGEGSHHSEKVRITVEMFQLTLCPKVEENIHEIQSLWDFQSKIYT